MIFDTGPNAPWVALLRQIAARPPEENTMPSLESRLGWSEPRIRRWMRKLEHDGLVASRLIHASVDRGTTVRRILWITPAGRARLEEIRREWNTS